MNVISTISNKISFINKFLKGRARIKLNRANDSFTIKAKTKKDLTAAKKMFERDINAINKKKTDKRGKPIPAVTIRWNEEKKVKGSYPFFISGTIRTEIYRHWTSFRNNEVHFANEYGYSAWHLTVRIK